MVIECGYRFMTDHGWDRCILARNHDGRHATELDPPHPSVAAIRPRDPFGNPDEDVDASILERLPQLLRRRTCGWPRYERDDLGQPKDDPAKDHGHTNCYLMGLAAREIERLRADPTPR